MMRTIRWFVVAVLLLACPCVAQESAPKAAPPTEDAAQLKAMIVKLQRALLEKEREAGILRATVAELQMSALDAAIETMGPDVKKALGRPEQKPVEKPVPKE